MASLQVRQPFIFQATYVIHLYFSILQITGMHHQNQGFPPPYNLRHQMPLPLHLHLCRRNRYRREPRNRFPHSSLPQNHRLRFWLLVLSVLRWRLVMARGTRRRCTNSSRFRLTGFFSPVVKTLL